MKNGGKRNPLSDLTNSNHFSSSSVSSSATIIHHPIVNIQNKTRFNPVHVKQQSLPVLSGKIQIQNQKKTLAALPTPLTVRCRKKQRVLSAEQVELEDFIQKQKAYYKEIDEFKLEEEEVVGSIDE